MHGVIRCDGRGVKLAVELYANCEGRTVQHRLCGRLRCQHGQPDVRVHREFLGGDFEKIFTGRAGNAAAGEKGMKRAIASAAHHDKVRARPQHTIENCRARLIRTFRLRQLTMPKRILNILETIRTVVVETQDQRSRHAAGRRPCAQRHQTGTSQLEAVPIDVTGSGDGIADGTGR